MPTPPERLEDHGNSILWKFGIVAVAAGILALLVWGIVAAFYAYWGIQATTDSIQTNLKKDVAKVAEKQGEYELRSDRRFNDLDTKIDTRSADVELQVAQAEQGLRKEIRQSAATVEQNMRRLVNDHLRPPPAQITGTINSAPAPQQQASPQAQTQQSNPWPGNRQEYVEGQALQPCSQAKSLNVDGHSEWLVPKIIDGKTMAASYVRPFGSAMAGKQRIIFVTESSTGKYYRIVESTCEWKPVEMAQP